VSQRIGDQDKWIVEAMSAIEVNVGNIDSGSGWFKEDGGRQEIETEWLNNQITEISHTMEVIFQLIDVQPTLCSSTIVLAWLQLVERYNYFDQFHTEDPTTEALFLPLKATATLISSTILSPGPCLEYLRNTDIDPRVSPDAPQDAPYIMNLKSLEHIHTILMRVSEEMFVNAAPMVLAWADILQTLALRIADKAGPEFNDDFDHSISTNDQVSAGKDAYYDTVVKMLKGPPDEVVDVIQYLASSAVDRGQVFQYLTDLALRLGGTSTSYFSALIGARMRLAILDLIRSSSAVGYIPEIVEASLAALTGGQTYWNISDAQQLHRENDPLDQFLMDPDLLELLIVSAKHRYPYESALLKLTRSLAPCCGVGRPSIIQWIGTMDTFTCILPDSFTGYTTTQEEENNNSVRLTSPLQLFEERVRTRGLQNSTLVRIDEDFVIPSGTYGRIINDAPKVAYWSHSYPGLKYFGKVSTQDPNFLLLKGVERLLIAAPTGFRDLLSSRRCN
jgi:nuclear pore complex protein Nup188